MIYIPVIRHTWLYNDRPSAVLIHVYVAIDGMHEGVRGEVHLPHRSPSNAVKRTLQRVATFGLLGEVADMTDEMSKYPSR